MNGQTVGGGRGLGSWWEVDGREVVRSEVEFHVNIEDVANKI